jgi:hypothetical protein
MNSGKQLLIEVTQLDFDFGDEIDFDLFSEYIKITQQRDRFIRGEISFEDYIDAISDSSVDTDDYLGGIADDLGLIY